MSKQRFSTLSLGILLIIAAIVKGGIEAPGGWKFPVLPDLKQDELLALFGAVLIESAFLPDIQKRLLGLLSRNQRRSLILWTLLSGNILVVAGLTALIVQPLPTVLADVPLDQSGFGLFLNSAHQDTLGPIPNWKWEAAADVGLVGRAAAGIRHFLTKPPNWSTGKYLTVERGESAWYAPERLPQAVRTMIFQVDLHKDQKSVSWVLAPSKKQISRVTFSPTNEGVQGTEYFYPNGTQFQNGQMAIPPALEGERLTVWAKLQSDDHRCHLQYTFQASQPNTAPPPAGTLERDIFDSLGNINSGGRCQSIPQTSQDVDPYFCNSDQLKIGFEAPSSGSGETELQIVGVTENSKSTCQ